MSPDDLNTTKGDDVTVQLPNDARAAGQARRTVRRTLTTWHLPTLVDNALLAVSELVTNAVKHGLPPVGLRLRKRTRELRMDVSDGRPDPVSLSRPPATIGTEESGRGLAIVRAVSSHSGSEHIPGHGKNMFASWDLDGAGPPVAKPVDPAVQGGSEGDEMVRDPHA